MIRDLVTYVIAPLNHMDFIVDFYNIQNFIKRANAVLIPGVEIFSKMMEDKSDDHEFYMILHYGDLQRGGLKKSELVKGELADYYNGIANSKFVYITRSQELFPKQQPYIIDEANNVYLNFNKCNSQEVLEHLIVYSLGELRGLAIETSCEAKLTSPSIKLPKVLGEEEQTDFAIQTALIEEFAPFQKACNIEPARHGVNMFKSRFKENMKIGKDDDYVGNFFVVHQEQMGLVDAAINASQTISNVDPLFFIMGGVCGGNEKKVKLYDVIIPTIVHDYATGKFKAGKLESLEYKANMNTSLVNFLKKNVLRIINNMRLMIDPGREGLMSRDFQIILAEFACGPWVVKSSGFLSDYLVNNVESDIVGLEMESYSILRASEVIQKRDRYSLVVKSVMDFTNELKSDGPNGEIKSGAAYISSLCIRALMPVLLEFSRQTNTWK
jgi:nucleoside phosphorylase